MSIQSLIEIARPPISERAHSPEEWAAAELTVSGRFPEDYKLLIDRYGTGCFDEFLWVLSPFSDNAHLNIVQRSKSILSALRDLHHFSVQLPHPLFPDNEGLFPWAVTDNGDELFWRYQNGTFSGPIMIVEARGPEWAEFNLTTTAFLALVLSKQVRVGIFPHGFPSAVPRFEST